MAKEKISEEDYDRLQLEAFHGDVVSALRELGKRNGDENISKLETQIAKQFGALLDAFNKKGFVADLQPLVTEISKSVKELKQVLGDRPKSFLVERNKAGLIERVVVE